MLEQASIIRQKRKTVKVVIDRAGNLIIYCPNGLTCESLERMLKRKERLLNKKILETKRISDKFREIINKESILVFGKKYLIVPTEKVKKASFTEEYFLIPKKVFETNKVSNCIVKNLKEIAERVIRKRFCDILQAHKNFEVSKLVFGTFKAKWGSCDTFNVIKLNWKLAMVEPKLIDFVIFHELSHTKEFNHSKKFYQILQQLCPDWKKSRQKLKEYSFVLNLY